MKKSWRYPDVEIFWEEVVDKMEKFEAVGALELFSYREIFSIGANSIACVNSS
jgi:hypothetical protein